MASPSGRGAVDLEIISRAELHGRIVGKDKKAFTGVVLEFDKDT